MLRISLIYIISLIIFSLLFVFMTLKYPNYFNQFSKNFNKEMIIKKSDYTSKK